MKYIPNNVSKKVARAVLQTKKNSPHIFFAGGVIGVLTGTVLACKATLKLEAVLDEAKDDITKVKALSETVDAPDSDYSKEDYYRDLGTVYGKTGAKMARLYGPAAVVGAVSIAALTGSHIQLARRNTALTVTLAAVSKAYEEYRVRIQEELGEERELDIYQDVQDATPSGTGKKKVEQRQSNGAYSPYARLFEESNRNWYNSNEHNFMFVRCQQQWANARLQSRGHVFLNEIYDALGMEHSVEGAVVGWVLDGEGDGYIDFGLDNQPDFTEGIERNVWLDFNVDGVVYDKI